MSFIEVPQHKYSQQSVAKARSWARRSVDSGSESDTTAGSRLNYNHIFSGAQGTFAEAQQESPRQYRHVST